MYLGKYFTLEEMCRTEREWVNAPYDIYLVELTRLVSLVLDPLREAVGPLTVTSGYRSPEVNREVGGAMNSFHVEGRAADIVHADLKPKKLINWILRLDLPFDKVIAEDNGTSQWLHVQIQPPDVPNRFEQYRAYMDDGVMKYAKLT